MKRFVSVLLTILFVQSLQAQWLVLPSRGVPRTPYTATTVKVTLVSLGKPVAGVSSRDIH